MVGREAEEVVVLKFHDVFHTALETESVLSVVDGLANMVVELAHKDGSTVRALMSRTIAGFSPASGRCPHLGPSRPASSPG
jgi:hypothetical protein